MMKWITILTLLGVWLANGALAIDVTAYRVDDHAMSLDGLLDEEAWKQCAVTDDFQGVHGQKEVEYQTRIRVLYSDRCLYLGIEAQIPTGTVPQSAGVYDGDRVEMALRTTLEDTYYYIFTVSACNVREDCAFANVDYSIPEDFDSTWETQAVVKDGVWCAEAKIPFAAFENDPPPKAGSVWHINFCRGCGNSGGVVYSALDPAHSGFHNAACKLIFH